MEILWQKWPQWKAVSKIGHGSYGSVYKAGRTDQNMDTFSAIKVISVPSNEAELYSIEAEGYNAGQAREYFKKVAMTYVRESEVLKELRGEPNVVSIDDYYIEERKSGAGYDIFIRMELLTPLSHWLRDNSISEESAAKIGIDICTALEACEKHNIIHRDIKPENILCNSEGVFKLGDFGIARNLECLSGSLTRIGSENYIAPEIVYSKKYNGRVDIYSLGLVLYSLLNGRRLPFWPDGKEIITAGERHAAFSRRIKGEKIPPPKHCCAKLAKIILKACAFDPDDRYSSAKEMKKELEAFLEPVPKAKPAKRSVRFVTAALVALVLTAGVCFGISKLPRAADTQKDGKTASVMDELADPADFDRTEPTEPDPVEPEPVGPEPTEPDPVEPEPVEPEPVEPEPVEPEPVEPDPVEPDPVEPDPVEPEPVEPDPVEPDPVEPQPADVITLDRSFAALGTKGETLQLTASGVSGGNGGGAFKWESSANSVVTVDQNGLVTAVSNGIARITAQTYDGSSKATCKIIVRLTDNVDLEYFGYNVSNGEATITAVDTAISGDITIPTALGGYPVTAIGAQAFYDCRDVTSVTIPEGITTIGYYAFRNCHNIKSVSIPLSVTAIGDSAFWDCNKLETVYIPASVTDIGEVAFAACNSLTSINVDTDNPAYKSVDGVLYSKDGKTLIQYPRKKSGESYNIPTNVTQIGKQAFWFCRDLIAVTVPAGVTAIGFSAFSGCDKLASVNVDAGNPVYKSQGGVLYSKDGKTLICYPGGRDDKSFTVPAEVTSIYQSAFYDCENLTAVTIHDNVSYIGADAFTRCSSLVIYAECMFQPMSWAEGWNYSERPVVWGCGSAEEDPVEPDHVEPEPTEPEPVEPEPMEPEPVEPEPTEPEPVEPEPTDPEPSNPAIQYIRYSVSNGEAAIVGFDKSYSGAVTIPSTLGGYPVTSIGDEAFMGCTEITGVTVPDTVTQIGASAFRGCKKLADPDGFVIVSNILFDYFGRGGRVTVPDGTVAVSNAAFIHNPAVVEIVIPDSVTSIGHSAFFGSAVTKINIPDGVSFIDGETFAYCKYLTSITIPDSVTSIGLRAFSACDGLTDITIGSGVTSIATEAFYSCGQLTNVYLPDGLTSVGAYMLADCMNLRSITIPDSVSSIGNCAFQGCGRLTDVTVGSGVTSIGMNAFDGCFELSSINIPLNVANIGVNAFRGCSNLTIYAESASKPDGWIDYWNPDSRPVVWGYGTQAEDTSAYTYNISDSGAVITAVDTAISGDITIPAALGGCPVVSIGEYAFYQCSDLTSVTIPEGVTSICNSAFESCHSLRSISVPNSVISIGDYAFYDCRSLTDITIPGSVLSIGADVFFGCSSLSAINVDGSNTEYKDIDGVLLTSDGKILIKYPSNKADGDYVIPYGVLSITVYAFRNCTNLTSITIPDTVTTIGTDAFCGCIGLSSVIIPHSVEFMGGYVFENCTGITIYAEAASQPEGWSNEWNADDRPVVWGYGTQAEDTSAYTYTVANGTATITAVDTSVSGDITVPATLDGYPVVSISDRAFFNCDGITSVTIPESVTAIGQEAFYSCDSLTGVTVPEGIGAIGSGVFYGCSSLTSVNIPNSVTRIGSYAFCGCSALTSIHIPDGVTAIGDGAFDLCSSLVSITVPESVTALGEWLFTDCTKLESIVAADGNSVYKSVDGVLYDKSGTTLVRYPEGKTNSSYAVLTGVTSIGQRAFYNCDRLTSITIPEGVDTIGSDAFAHSNNLSDVNIPESVATIGEYAFEHCSALTSVVIPSGVTTVGSYAFGSCSSLTIYAEAASQPEGWSNEWNLYGCPVEWGYGSAEE